MNILPLFASCVFYDYVEEDTDELKTYDDFISTPSAPTESSRDKRVLLKYPRIAKLLIDKFRTIAKEDLHYDQNFEISTSWFTRTHVNGYSQYHNHKNCFYSGIYYFGEYSDDSGLIEFQNPIKSLPDFYMEPFDSNIINSTVWQIPPESKKLIFFPSYLNHRIMPHHNNISRRSLAFNIVPTGRYGGVDSVYDTQWFT